MSEGSFKEPMRFALSAVASVNALQQTLITDLNLTTDYSIGSSKVSDEAFSDMLTTARIECIDSMEAYFSGDLQPAGCISERNEGAAISLILQRSISDEGGPAAIKARLASHAQQLSEALFSEYTQHQKGTFGSNEGTRSSDEGALRRWAQERHLESSIEPKHYGGMKGAAAKELLEAGATAVSVPEQCLIHEGTAAASDIGKALTALGIDGELLLILYSMIDRHDPDSGFAPVWQSLPKNLRTGLSMTEELIILEGTPAADAIKAAQQHVRSCFEVAMPALSALTEAFPDDILPEHVSEEAFLWAAQLWYSYGMEVEFPDGQRRQCLIPVACLMNHSPWPHVIRYGQVDPGSRRLTFPVFRSCRPGEQCLMSYGPLPNLKLLLFYGFTLPHNPSDTVSISFEMPDDSSAQMREHLLMEHHLNLHSHYLGRGSLAPSLLAALRLAVGDYRYLSQVAEKKMTPLQEGAPELEQAVKKALRSAMQPLLQAYERAHERWKGYRMVMTAEIGIDEFIQGQIRILDWSIQLCQ